MGGCQSLVQKPPSLDGCKNAEEPLDGLVSVVEVQPYYCTTRYSSDISQCLNGSSLPWTLPKRLYVRLQYLASTGLMFKVHEASVLRTATLRLYTCEIWGFQ